MCQGIYLSLIQNNKKKKTTLSTDLTVKVLIACSKPMSTDKTIIMILRLRYNSVHHTSNGFNAFNRNRNNDIVQCFNKRFADWSNVKMHICIAKL